jgi:hypothetical protein
VVIDAVVSALLAQTEMGHACHLKPRGVPVADPGKLTVVAASVQRLAPNAGTPFGE